MKYGILRYPHQNSRYFDATKNLLEAEFCIIMDAMNMQYEVLGYKEIGGIEIFVFESPKLNKEGMDLVKKISSNFILFKLHDEFLIPCNENKETYFNKDLSSILKYNGKTNEDFTSMLINLAVFASDFKDKYDEQLKVFDPMCGRGTTLYESLIRGYNSYGVELNKVDVTELNNYLKRYLKHHKYKHSTAHQTIVMNGEKKGVKYTIETADTIENFKANHKRTIQFANGNTIDTNCFYKKDSFHVIVTDLPYGVQHKSKSGKGGFSMIELLGEALDGWKKVLKKGGTVVIAFNSFNLNKDKLGEIFENNGFEVVKEGYFNKLEHWVEQAVQRDVFIAKKL